MYEYESGIFVKAPERLNCSTVYGHIETQTEKTWTGLSVGAVFHAVRTKCFCTVQVRKIQKCLALVDIQLQLNQPAKNTLATKSVRTSDMLASDVNHCTTEKAVETAEDQN